MLEKNNKRGESLTKIIAVHHLIQKHYEEILKKCPISYLEANILCHILNFNETQYKIAKRYNISTQRMNQISNNLEKYGYIKKIDVNKDSKVIRQISITETGKNLISSILDDSLKRLEALGLKENDIIQFERALETISEIFKKKIV